MSFYVTRGSVTFHGGVTQTVSAGERIDVSVGVHHTAVVGNEGCEYVVGQEVEGWIKLSILGGFCVGDKEKLKKF